MKGIKVGLLGVCVGLFGLGVGMDSPDAMFWAGVGVFIAVIALFIKDNPNFESCIFLRMEN